jgi:hypothetical protein
MSRRLFASSIVTLAILSIGFESTAQAQQPVPAVPVLLAREVEDVGRPTRSETSTIAQTVYREQWVCVRVYRRHGFRCIPQDVLVKRLIPETVNKEVTRTVQIPYASELPNPAFASRSVTLQAPRSAGAISRQVAQLLDGQFPAADFPMDRQVDAQTVQYVSLQPANDDVSYDFIVRVNEQDGRLVTIEIAAAKVGANNGQESQPFADSRADQIRQLVIQ